MDGRDPRNPTGGPSPQSNPRPRLGIWIGVGAAIVILMMLVFAGGPDDPRVGDETGVPPAGQVGVTEDTQPVDTAELPAGVDLMVGTVEPEGAQEAHMVFMDNPLALVGSSVKVRGEINEVIAPRAFLLDRSDGTVNDEILVLYRPGDVYGQVPSEGNEAIVEGEVVHFTLADYAAFLGPDADPTVFAQYEMIPAIIASPLAH